MYGVFDIRERELSATAPSLCILACVVDNLLQLLAQSKCHH